MNYELPSASTSILTSTWHGEKAMIGAGAVVTEDVPAGVVVVGAPARLVRQVDAPAR